MKTVKYAVLWCVYLGVLAMIGCLAGTPAPAQGPRTRYGHDELQQHNGASVTYDSSGNRIRHRDVVRIVEVAQINPAYLSAYSPEGYDAVTQGTILQQIQALTAQIGQLQAQLKAPPVVAPVVVVPPVKPGDPPVVVQPPAPVAQPGPLQPAAGPVVALTILNTHCAACHMAGKLLPDQKFTLLDAKGALVTLTDKQKLRLVQKTRTAMMPPPSNTYGIAPLSDVEFAAVADLMGQ